MPNARTHTHSWIRRVLFSTKLVVSGLKPLAAAHPLNMFLCYVASIHVKVEGDCSCEGGAMPPIEIVLRLCVCGAGAVVWNGSGCEASISAIALLRCKAQGCTTLFTLFLLCWLLTARQKVRSNTTHERVDSSTQIDPCVHLWLCVYIFTCVRVCV